MARPAPKPKPLYKSRTTGYIYRIAHRTTVKVQSSATPAPPAFDLYTLRFEGRHPDDENVIVVSESDLAEGFTIYEPIKAATPGRANEQTAEQG